MSESAQGLIEAKALEHGFTCYKAKIDDDDYCLQFETLTPTEKND